MRWTPRGKGIELLLTTFAKLTLVLCATPPGVCRLDSRITPITPPEARDTIGAVDSLDVCISSQETKNDVSKRIRLRPAQHPPPDSMSLRPPSQCRARCCCRLCGIHRTHSTSAQESHQSSSFHHTLSSTCTSFDPLGTCAPSSVEDTQIHSIHRFGDTSSQNESIICRGRNQ